jgi:hypothetical protein
MRFASHFILSALLVLSWTGIASAEDPTQAPPTEAVDFAAVTNMQLDVAFEKFVARGDKAPLQGPSGPSSMACQNGEVSNELETCTVTADDLPEFSVPAALAQH